jgi:hypothetical protein
LASRAFAFNGRLLCHNLSPAAGNFGDGAIHAFDPATGKLLGALTNTDGNPIVVDDLWGPILGNGTAGTPRTAFFADEGHGLLGAINLAS